jgi:D-lactate dehydrogenase (cytochrome)
MFRPTCTSRLFARAISYRAPAALSRSHKDLLGALRVRHGDRPSCLTRFYSTSSAGGSNGIKNGYIREIILASAACAGLAATLGIYYNARIMHSESLRLRTETSSVKSESSVFETHYASPKELQLAIQELRQSFPDEHVIRTDPETLRLYGSSENSYHPTSPHSAVIRIRSTEDVVKVVNISRKYRVPLTAYSGATSLEGQFAGVRGLFAP